MRGASRRCFFELLLLSGSDIVLRSLKPFLFLQLLSVDIIVEKAILYANARQTSLLGGLEITSLLSWFDNDFLFREDFISISVAARKHLLCSIWQLSTFLSIIQTFLLLFMQECRKACL